MTVHAPAAHPLTATRGSAQAASQAPQCAGSTAVSAQSASTPDPQARRGDPQVVPHAPPEHTCPAAQARPHAPQLALSVRVLTSQPSAAFALQSAKPAAHPTRAHAPAVQAAVALGSAQGRWHAPQLVALVWRLVSQPLSGAPSQSPYPVAQPTTVHAPEAHPGVETFGSAQPAPHAPQCAGLLVVFAQKVADPVPQVRRGDAQVVAQTPPEHTCPAVQVTPQAPQLVASERVSTSQPSAGFMLQSAKPARHAVTAQAPALQALVAFARAQARPHAPQLVALALRSVSQPLDASPSQSPSPPTQRTTVHALAAQPWVATPVSAQV